MIKLNKGDEAPNEVVNVLTQNVLAKLQCLLEQSKARRRKINVGAGVKQLQEELQKILLYKTIFAEELEKMTTKLRQSGQTEKESKEDDHEGLEEKEVKEQAEEGSVEPARARVTPAYDPEKILLLFDRKFPAEGTKRF